MSSKHVWRPRFTALANAQTQYFYMVGVAGLSYLALFVGVDLSAAGKISLQGIKLSSGLVWATGPAVLGFLIQAVTGAITATDTAAWRMAVLEEEEFEKEYTSPGAIDLAFYTTHQSPTLVRALRLLVYPVYLTIFWLEGIWFSIILWLPEKVYFEDAQAVKYVLATLGTLLILAALPRLLMLWRRKSAHARAILTHKNAPVRISSAITLLADITDSLRGAGCTVESSQGRGYYTMEVDGEEISRARSLQGLAIRTKEWAKKKAAASAGQSTEAQ